jgi:hypothetical protein
MDKFVKGGNVPVKFCKAPLTLLDTVPEALSVKWVWPVIEGFP